MGSYIGGKLREALGSQKYDSPGKSSSVIRDWTPNNIRVLIVGLDFIYMLSHLRGHSAGKFVLLEAEKLEEELMSPYYGSPKLNTILNKRVLSCLEEIYVSNLYLRVPSVINLESYINGLKGKNSRLRAYGYGELSLQGSQMAISSWACGNTVGSLLAKDGGLNLSWKMVDNHEWYKHYYLRPEYYLKDKPNGNLAVHFKKVEKEYALKQSKDKARSESDSLKESYERSLRLDLESVDYIGSLLSVAMRMKSSSNEFDKKCSDAIRKSIKVQEVQGLTVDLVRSVLGDNRDSRRLCEAYSLMGMLSMDKTKLRVTEGGYINLFNVMDNMCLGVADVCISNGMSDSVKMSISMNKVPKSKFRTRFLKDNKGEDGTADDLKLVLGDMLGGFYGVV